MSATLHKQDAKDPKVCYWCQNAWPCGAVLPLTITEAAARAHRTTRTIEKWISDGLPVTRTNGIRYIRTDDLNEYLRKQIAAPRGGKGTPRLRHT